MAVEGVIVNLNVFAVGINTVKKQSGNESNSHQTRTRTSTSIEHKINENYYKRDSLT